MAHLLRSSSNTVIRVAGLGLTLIGMGCLHSTSKRRSLIPLRVHTIAISVSDLESSIDWYRDHLGFRLLQRRDFPDYELFSAILGGVGFRLELIEKSGSISEEQFLLDPEVPTLNQGYKKIVIETQNLDELFDSLRGSGVVFVYGEIRETPEVWGRWFMIEDRDGNVIQVVESSS